MTKDSGEDRRKKTDRRLGGEMRRVADRRTNKAAKPPVPERRSGADRRNAADRRSGRDQRRGR